MTLTPAERAKAARILRTRAARRRAQTVTLTDFVREAWAVLEPGTPLTWGWHIDAICAHLEAVTEGRIKRLIINVPPGHMKSLLVSVFWPAWMWLRRPDLRYLAVTHSQTLSLRDAVRMRTLVTSDWYRRTFAPDWELRADVAAKGLFETTRTGHRLSMGVTGNVTGHRGDGIIIDDPLGVEAAYSDAERGEANRIIRETLPTRLNSLVDGWMVLIMQRLHEDDATGMLLDSEDWECLSLPSEYDPERACETSIGFVDPRTEPGELLFPERFPAEVLERLKAPTALGSLAYAAQHQQRPAPAEGLLFKSEWFVRLPLHEFPTRPEQVLMSCDLSFGSIKETASRVSIGLWHYAQGRLYRVAEVVRAMSYTETRATIERLYGEWTPGMVLVESKANGPAIIDDLRSVIPCMVPVETGTRSKMQRAVAVLPMCEAGNVVIPSDAPWADAYLHELTTFPRARHDDRVDETSQVLSRFIRAPSSMPEQPTNDATQRAASQLTSMHQRSRITF